MIFRIRDRIALAIYALFGVCAALAIGYIFVVVERNAVSIVLLGGLAASVILLVYSLCMLRLALRRKPRKDKTSVTVQNTDQGNGEVRVSVQALDALVKQAIMGHTEGVTDIKTSIVNHEDSISVKIEMSLNGDVHIPNITMLLQSTIKSFIEEFSGIAVRDVSIMVNTIIPVMPQLAIAEQSAPETVVLTEDEHGEIPAVEAPAEEPAPTPAEEPAEEPAPAQEESAEEAQDMPPQEEYQPEQSAETEEQEN